MSSYFIFDADYPRRLLLEGHEKAFPEGVGLLRNWHFEDPVCWSRGPLASLAVEQVKFPSPVELILEVEVFNASEENPKTLTVESFGNSARHYVFTTSERRRIVVVTPRFEVRSPPGEIVFRLDKIESPFQIGLAMDDRMLGLAIHAISTIEDWAILPFDLTAPADVGEYLVSGWSVPEANGIWTDADIAEIRLERGRISEVIGVDLTFDVMSRPDTAPPLTIKVSCNGSEIETHSLASGEDLKLRVPFTTAPLLAEDQQIRIEMENLASPAELGRSTDGRRLGVFLKRIDPVYPSDCEEFPGEVIVS